MDTLRRCINLQIIWCIVDVVDTIAPALTIEQAARTGLNPKTPAPAEARLMLKKNLMMYYVDIIWHKFVLIAILCLENTFSGHLNRGL